MPSRPSGRSSNDAGHDLTVSLPDEPLYLRADATRLGQVFANLLHNVVERHGGRVDAYSDGRGAGSTFVVRLPLAAPAAAGSPAAPVEASAPAARRILVVDDNEDAATSLAMLLGIMGHDARTTFDGASALEEAARFRPHVALLDLGMPALDGYDVARRIRRESWGRDVMLVALTGWGQEEHKRRSEQAGFDRHLVKPVDRKALEALLAS